MSDIYVFPCDLFVTPDLKTILDPSLLCPTLNVSDVGGFGREQTVANC